MKALTAAVAGVVGLWFWALSAAATERLEIQLNLEQALEQVPPTVDLALRGSGLSERLSPAALASLRAQTLAELGALDLPGVVRHTLAELPAASRDTAAALLATAEVVAVREAERAPAGADEARELEAYRQRLSRQAPLAARRALVERAVRADRAAAIAALLQTGIERRLLNAARAAGHAVALPLPQEWEWMESERSAFLREALVEHGYYAYRYTSNQALREYLAAMEQPAIQEALDAAIGALRKALDS